MVTGKEYCYLFINSLIQNKKLEDNAITKVDARKVYYELFKPLNPRRKFSFFIMHRTIIGWYLGKFQGNMLVFEDCVIQEIMQKDNSNITNLNPARFASKKIPPIKDFECKICKVKLADAASYNSHIMTNFHIRLDAYLNKKSSLVNPIPGLTIKVEEHEGVEPFFMTINENKEFMLKICNYSGKCFRITEIVRMIPRDDIILHQIKSLILGNGTEVTLKINVCFKNIEYITYPLIFCLQDTLSEHQDDILKELMFNVHSPIVNELHATEVYKKVELPSVDSITIIPGVHVERMTSSFKPQLILKQYEIPQDWISTIKNNFHYFEGITVKQSMILTQTRVFLHDFYHKFQGKLHQKNYYQMLQLCLYLEEYQMKVNIRRYSGNNILTPIRRYSKNFLQLQVPGLAEHRPSLLRGDSVYVSDNAQSNVQYEGVVHEVLLDSVILGFSSSFINSLYINKKLYYTVFGFNRLPLRAEHQALELMTKHCEELFLTSNNFQPKKLKDYETVWFNKNIANNIQQQRAVKHILSQTSRPMPYLVFGPPGTGKTVTIVEAILQVWKLFKTDHILVCAPSNSAADEIAKNLVPFVCKMDLIRYVAQSYPYDKIHASVKEYVNYVKGQFYHPSINVLKTYKIVVTTLVNASRLVNGGMPANHFKYVFIDEAGQATETETLIAIAGILTSENQGINGQIILAGDPKQLGSVIHSSKAIHFGFDISMLERLMTHVDIYQKDEGQYNENFITKLKQSYRSHPAILEVPNKLFYENELMSFGSKTMTHIAIGWEHLPNPDFPVIFHSVFGNDEREQNSPSFFNVLEINVVLNYLKLLIGSKLSGIKISEKHIGIITPYRKQVQKLQQACLKEQYSNELFIGSVEQVQGQERLIIIVTTVRSKPEYTSYDSKFHLGFLRNPKRFNVAITRAIGLLIVVGNPKILLLDSSWHAFIKHCVDNRAINGTNFNLETDVCEVFERLQVDEENLVSGLEDEGPNFVRGII